MPLYIRGRSLGSFLSLTTQAATLAPWSRVAGLSIRVHLKIREDSFRGGLTRGRVLRDVGRVGAEADPADTVESCLTSGAKGRTTRRSCDGTEKKP